MENSPSLRKGLRPGATSALLCLEACTQIWSLSGFFSKSLSKELIPHPPVRAISVNLKHVQSELVCKEGSPPHPSAPPPPGTSVCIFISHLDDHTERSLPCLSWLCQSLFCIFRSLWISPLWTWPWVQSSIYSFHCLINVSFSDHSLMRKGPTLLVGSIQSLVPRMVPDS